MGLSCRRYPPLPSDLPEFVSNFGRWQSHGDLLNKGLHYPAVFRRDAVVDAVSRLSEAPDGSPANRLQVMARPCLRVVSRPNMRNRLPTTPRLHMLPRRTMLIRLGTPARTEDITLRSKVGSSCKLRQTRISRNKEGSRYTLRLPDHHRPTSSRRQSQLLRTSSSILQMRSVCLRMDAWVWQQ